MTKHDSNIGMILIVDDDLDMGRTLQEFLSQEGYMAETAMSADEALEIADQHGNLALALVDLIMPIVNGLQLMERLQAKIPELPVIIMTGYGTIENAVESLKRGAEDYITKPFDKEAVRKKIARVMELSDLRARVAKLEANLKHCCTGFDEIVGASPSLLRVIDRARAAADTDASVLLLGETGCGKEMLARAIHRSSPRKTYPFIPLNCGAIPRELVESELFGHKKGAFTGAYADSVGLFAAASGGTVLLDEVAELPKEAQVKLLRVLQEGEVRPVGSSKSLKVNVRLISATNQPLAALRGDRLREDLYFRIATVIVEVPPLRARREDILVLAEYFIRRLSHRYNREISMSHGTGELLLGYDFPGNVRELENILESVVAVFTGDAQVITDKDLKPLLDRRGRVAEHDHNEQPLSLEVLERVAIERALRLSHGNRTKAALILGISRDTLHRKLRQASERTEPLA